MSPLAVSGACSCANNLSRQQYLHPGATRQQYHQPVSVLAEVDPIARVNNPVLINAGANTFHVREITLFQPMNCRRHLDRGSHIQTIEAFRNARTTPYFEHVTSSAHSHSMVAGGLPLMS